MALDDRNKPVPLVLKFAIAFSLVCAGQVVRQPTVQAAGTTYYVSQSGGSDSNQGTQASPWKTLAKVSGVTFSGGDRVLLKCGDTWTGETLYPHAVNADEVNWVTLASYGDAALGRPKIFPGSSIEWAIKIESTLYDDDNCGWKIKDLEVGYAEMGIGMVDLRPLPLKLHTDGTYHLDGFWVENCYIHDITGIVPNTDPTEATRFSSGIRTFSKYVTTHNVTFKNNVTDYCDIGIQCWWSSDLLVDKCTSTNSGYFGMEFYVIFDALIQNCTILYSGRKPIFSGVTGIEFDGGQRILFRDSEVAYTKTQPNTPDGCGVDYETSQQSITTDNCYIHDNEGRAFLIMKRPDEQMRCNITNNVISDNGWKTNEQEAAFAHIEVSEKGGVVSGNVVSKAYTGQAENRVGSDFINGSLPGFTYSNNTVIEAPADPWEFNTNAGGWSAAHDISYLAGIRGNLFGTISGIDPYMMTGDNLGISITGQKLVKIRLKNCTDSTGAEIFFTTNSSTGFDEAKRKYFSIVPSSNGDYAPYREYLIDMSDVPAWTGTLRRLRIDPAVNVTSGTFMMDYVRLESIPPAVSPDTVGSAKTSPDGSLVTLDGAVVTEAFTGFFYVESQNRSAGIRVNKLAHLLSAGQLVKIAGTMRTNADFERYIDAATVVGLGQESVEPVTLTARDLSGANWSYYDPTGFGQRGVLGGVGLNNIGLLVKVWGRVTQIEPVTSPAQPTWFKIADGSGRTVKCVAESGSLVINPAWQGMNAVVTGVSSCEFDGLDVVTKIRMKRYEDPVLN